MGVETEENNGDTHEGRRGSFGKLQQRKRDRRVRKRARRMPMPLYVLSELIWALIDGVVTVVLVLTWPIRFVASMLN